MVFDPFVGWGESNTKLTIIHILTKYSSLSAKRIYNRLKKEFGVSVSYQATHKALKKMQESRIIDYISGEYKINPEWVKRMKVFAEQLEKSPNTITEIFSSLDSGKTVSFTVRNEMEMGYFVLDFMANFSKTGGKGPLILNLFLVWTILPLNDEQFLQLKGLIKKHGVYVVSQEGLVYDKIMKKQWENAGGRVAIGIKDCVSNCDVIVIGDYIINIYWDPEHLEKEFEDSRRIEKEGDINYNRMYELMSAPTKIDFIITKNKEV